MGLIELRSNEETSRAGVKWLEDEYNDLLRELDENKNWEEIAINHKRTIIGVQSKAITTLIYKLYKNENKTIEELATKFKIER